jgi:hypothetical protein
LRGSFQQPSGGFGPVCLTEHATSVDRCSATDRDDGSARSCRDRARTQYGPSACQKDDNGVEAGPSTGAGIDLDILINGASAINDHPHVGVGESQSTEARLNVPVFDGDEIRLQLTGTLSDATGPFLAHVWIDGN